MARDVVIWPLVALQQNAPVADVTESVRLQFLPKNWAEGAASDAVSQSEWPFQAKDREFHVMIA